jgi:hypothetical protein
VDEKVKLKQNRAEDRMAMDVTITTVTQVSDGTWKYTLTDTAGNSVDNGAKFGEKELKRG